MKKFTIVVLLTLAAASLNAKDISQQQALLIARQFIGSAASPKGMAKSPEKLTAAYTATSAKGNKCLYVFNNGTNRGFVVVAGDDRANQILGYSDTGSFDWKAIPEQMRNWITGYADEIDYLKQNPQLKAAAQESAKYARPVAPLLGNLQWNQDSPYNDLCPKYDLTQRCPTGCVATAMAQIMYYNRWPETGTGSHTYQPSILAGESLSANFGETTYQWDKMLPQYDKNSSDESREAVAKLMFHCGVSVNMEYNISSGAASQPIPYAFFNYFGYDKGVAYRQRANYSSDEWQGVIINELDHGRPVLATGVASSGGHAFVFDGYDADGLIHVNWGWGGMSNGYFRTSALNPSSQGIGGADGGFNYNQQIITGIQRPQANTYSDVELVSTEGLAAEQNDIEVGKPFDISLRGFIHNAGWQDANFVLGLLLADEKGDTVAVYNTKMSGSMPMSMMGTIETFKGVNLGQLSEGSYRLYPVCRDQQSTGQWLRVRDEYVGYPNWLSMTVKGGTMHFDNPGYFKLEATSVEAPTEIYAKVPSRVSATVKNNGEVNYLGEVATVIINKKTNLVVGRGTNLKLDLQPGDSLRVALDGTFNLAPGQYSLAIVDDDDRRLCPDADFEMKEAPTQTATMAMAEQLAFDNAQAVDPTKMNVTAHIRCDKGVFGGYAYLILASANGATQVGSLDPVYFFAKEGETADVSFSGRFENGVPSQTYSALLLLNDGTQYLALTPKEMSVCQFTLDKTSGIGSATTSTKAEPIRIYGLNGQLLPQTDINALPHGIYIVKQGGKARKVVK